MNSVMKICVLAVWVTICASLDDQNLNDRSRINNGINNQRDPCAPYNPPVPDFSAPDRRISIQSRMTKHLEESSRNRDKDIASGALSNQKKTLYILGGQAATVYEFPHMGAIGWKRAVDGEPWKFMCGSALISPRYVLTAAHCTQASPWDTSIDGIVPQIVRFGVNNIHQVLSSRIVDRNIKRIISHPKYKSPIKYFDIALMELDKDVEFAINVQPACLRNAPIDNINEVSVTGWGVTNINDREGTRYLQAATLHILDNQTCDRLLRPKCNRNWCGLQEHQFCAGRLAGGIDACQGDSGGPLQKIIPLPTTEEGYMYQVIGVTSFGIGCGRQNLPAVYSKVSYFVDWIESIVWK